MRRHFLCCLAVTILLSTPHSVSAKAPTVRITITGGGLTSPIQITDGEILDMSDAWGTAFLDSFQPPLTKAPNVSSTYEVALYSRMADNDIRKTCVLYYSPRFSAEQGFIYLPGTGPVWWLNAGTMIRQGRDGRWSYASSAWETLIKPLIARGQQDGRGSTLLFNAKVAARAQTNRTLFEGSEIKLEQWTRSRPGWLYVLDPRSEPEHLGSRVWLVDPETAKVMGSVKADDDPDFALSPDGSQLYIASGERDSGELAVIDTEQGKVLRVPFPERVLYQPWYEGLPPFSRMTVSSDGGALWILDVFSPDKIEYQLRTFDTRNKRFLAAGVPLGNCGYGDFISPPSSRELQFVCPATRSVHLIRLNASYDEESNVSINLPWSESCGVAEGTWLSDNKLAIVRTDGAVYELDKTSQTFSLTARTGDCAPSKTDLVFPFQWPRSPDDSKVYLGFGPPEPDGTATSREFRTFDTKTWKELASFRTSVPFWSAVVNRDGRILYAPAPKEHSILVLDTALGQERHPLHVGQTPTLTLIAP